MLGYRLKVKIVSSSLLSNLRRDRTDAQKSVATGTPVLPRYVMAPGVIGACCAGITAILSVFAGIQCVTFEEGEAQRSISKADVRHDCRLHKGNGYHDKVESNERRNHRDKEENEPQATLDALKHKSHPFCELTAISLCLNDTSTILIAAPIQPCGIGHCWAPVFC